MDNKTLLAIIISVIILIGYQFLFQSPQTPVSPEKATKEPAKEGPKKPEANQKPAIVPVPKTESAVPEKSIVVENDLFKAILSSRGGTIKSVELKRFKDKNNKPMVLNGDETVPALSIGLDEGFQFANVNFSVKGNDIKLSPSATMGTVIFEYSTGDTGIRRIYTFSHDNYGFSLKDEVKGINAYLITLGKNFGIYEQDDSEHTGPVVLRHADREAFEAKDLKDTKHFKDGVKWVAQEDKYFFSAIVPRGAIEDALVWKKNDYALVGLKMNQGVNEYFIYAGPKEYDHLKKFGSGLEHIVDFGWFSFLAIPLFWILKLFYDVFHNYGVAIIILTAVVRIPFIPIVNMGQRSMKKMQDIQPKIAEIREKYKKDPQKLQKETMELYRQHKVNPMSGCLPMVLQIPVFFALYKILLIAIELRGAPLAWWVHDLSAKDPYYILPIIMGVTMVIQQKMTPSAMDPRQQKLMMLMPIIFTFMFLSFPSGLVLYWLANNVLSIIQQYFVNKKLAKQPA